MANLNLKAIFTSDTTDIKRGASTTKKELEKLGYSVKKLQGTMITAFAAGTVLSFAKSSIEAWDKQAQALSNLNSVLKSTGGAVGLSSQQLQIYASELQNVTTIGDETTIQAMALLATFKSIKGQTFKDTIATAQDLSTILGGDLQQAILKLGKALETPAVGLTALRRSGVSFTEEQIALVKKLVAEGKKQEAQTLILAEVQSQFGGAAEAAAMKGLGAWKQFFNQFDDFKENLGSAVGLTSNLGSDLTSNFKNLNTVLVSSANLINKIVYTLGTITFVFPGLQFVTDKIKNFEDGIGIGGNKWYSNLISKFTGVFSGKGILSYAENEAESIKKRADVAQLVAKGYVGQINSIADAEKKLKELKSKAQDKDWVVIATNSLKEYIKNQKEFQDTSSITYLEDQVKVAKENWEAETDPKNREALKQIYIARKKELDALTDINAESKNGRIPQLEAEVKKINSLINSETNLTKLRSLNNKKDSLQKQIDYYQMSDSDISELAKSAAPNLNIDEKNRDSIKEFKKKAKSDLIKTFEEIDDIVNWDEVLFNDRDFQNVNRKAEEMANIMNDVALTIERSFEDLAASFGESIGELISGSGNIGDMGKSLLNGFGELLVSLGKIAISAGIGIEAIKAAFESMSGIGAIAIGISLVALGTAIKSSIKDVGRNASSYTAASYSSIGSVSSSSSSAPEYSTKAITVNVTGELTARGNKLVATISNENKRRNLTS